MSQMTRYEIELLREKLSRLDRIDNFDQMRQSVWVLAEVMDKVLGVLAHRPPRGVSRTPPVGEIERHVKSL